MEIWLIENGERTGPHIDFEVRSRIHAGDLDQDCKVWYLDLDAWTTLGESQLFGKEFAADEELEQVTAENVAAYTARLERELGEQIEIAKKDSQSPQEGDGGESAPPQLPAQLHLWRRFAARWFDFLLYSLLMTAVLVWSGSNLVELGTNTLFAFISILPWFFLESLSTSLWGTTPGKWLAGLKVRDAEGAKLSAGSAILRTMRVIILGMGFGQGLLVLVCHSIAAWLGFRRNIVLWDTPVGTRVLLDNPTPQKWIALGTGFFLIVYLHALLVFPSMSQRNIDHLSPEEQRMWQRFFPPEDGADVSGIEE